jgi:hypothetical protein
MLLEYEYHKNDVVKTSIPEVDRTIADVKIEGLFDVEEEEEKIFEVDEILEKITKHGYENLSTEEKEFLDKKSRGEI